MNINYPDGGEVVAENNKIIVSRIGNIQILTGSVATSLQSYTLDYSSTPFKVNPRVSISQWSSMGDAVVGHGGRSKTQCPFTVSSTSGMQFDFIIIGEF